MTPASCQVAIAPFTRDEAMIAKVRKRRPRKAGSPEHKMSTTFSGGRISNTISADGPVAPGSSCKLQVPAKFGCFAAGVCASATNPQFRNQSHTPTHPPRSDLPNLNRQTQGRRRLSRHYGLNCLFISDPRTLDAQLLIRMKNQAIPKASSKLALACTKRWMAHRRSSIQSAKPSRAITASSEMAAPPRT